MAVLALDVGLGVPGSSSSSRHLAGRVFPRKMLTRSLTVWVFVLVLPDPAFGQLIFPFPYSASSLVL